MANVPATSSTLEELVLQPSSLEAFQAEIRMEQYQLREDIQAFGEDIKSEHYPLREGIQEFGKNIKLEQHSLREGSMA